MATNTKAGSDRACKKFENDVLPTEKESMTEMMEIFWLTNNKVYNVILDCEY